MVLSLNLQQIMSLTVPIQYSTKYAHLSQLGEVPQNSNVPK
jgi:hypothetical protein